MAETYMGNWSYFNPIKGDGWNTAKVTTVWTVLKPVVNSGIFTTNLNWWSPRRISNEPSTVGGGTSHHMFSIFTISPPIPGEMIQLNIFQMSNEKNPGYLLYIGDYTTQLYGDYNKPL